MQKNFNPCWERNSIVSKFFLCSNSREPTKQGDYVCHCLRTFKFMLFPYLSSGVSLLKPIAIQFYLSLSSKSFVSFILLSFCHTLDLTHQQVLWIRLLSAPLSRHSPVRIICPHRPLSPAQTIAITSAVISLLLFLHSYNIFSTKHLERSFQNINLIMIFLHVKFLGAPQHI